MHPFFETCIDAVFPARCVGCRVLLYRRAPFRAVCTSCFENVARVRNVQCIRCNTRLYEGRLHRCGNERTLPVLACTTYTNRTARELIHALKYLRIRSAAEPLAALVAEALAEHPWFYEHALLVPLPLHARRERVRGFNQTKLIAQSLEKYIPTLPMIGTKILVRTHARTPQAELDSWHAREKNIAGVFTVLQNTALDPHRPIILLDDVVTSGATAREAARVLYKHGARHVRILAVAHA